jgi:hypothetical protein
MGHDDGRHGGCAAAAIRIPGKAPCSSRLCRTPMRRVRHSPVDTMTPASVANPYFFAGYLRRFIGREMRVDSL